MAEIPVSCWPAVFQGITTSNIVISEEAMEIPTLYVSALCFQGAKKPCCLPMAQVLFGVGYPSSTQLPAPTVNQDAYARGTENSFF